MKIKTIQPRGSKILVVDDPDINKAYDCSQKRPIQLAVMSNYFSSSVYSVEDWRLSRYMPLSDTLEGGGPELYYPKSPEEREYMLSSLHTYREIEGSEGAHKGKIGIKWHTFDMYHWDGDNPDCRDKRGQEYSLAARFTYQGALERLAEIKEFWEGWDNPDLEKARIVNPHRQISYSDISMWRLENELKAREINPIETIKPHKKKI